MLTIYTVTVPVKDQAQADRLKQICIDYGLPILDKNTSFEYAKGYDNFFEFVIDEFLIHTHEQGIENLITEQQFIELLKNTRL